MANVTVPLECPCGHIINRAAFPDDPECVGWGTIRTQDYEEVIKREIACHEVSPDAVPNDDDPRAEKYHRSFNEAAQMIGSMFECPK